MVLLSILPITLSHRGSQTTVILFGYSVLVKTFPLLYSEKKETFTSTQTPCLLYKHLKKKTVIENVNLISSIVAKIELLHSRGQQVIIGWIHSHTGIISNEEADKAAYSAKRVLHIAPRIPPSLSQLKATLHRNIYISARNQHLVWIYRNSSLAKWYKEVTQCSPPPTLRNTPRSHTVIIHRLRLGYRCS